MFFYSTGFPKPWPRYRCPHRAHPMDGGLYIGRIAPDLGQTETARAGDQIGVQRVQRLASLGPCQAGKSTSIVRWFSESKLHWGCSNHVWIPNATGHRIPYKTRGFSTTIIFPEPPRFDIVWWFSVSQYWRSNRQFSGSVPGIQLVKPTILAILQDHDANCVVNYIVGWQNKGKHGRTSLRRKWGLTNKGWSSKFTMEKGVFTNHFMGI